MSSTPSDILPSADRRPAAAPDTPAQTSAPTASRRAELVHVLIAVRDPATRHSVGDWFSQRGYFVVVADAPERGPGMLRTVRFDLIVCDFSARSHRARHWLESILIDPLCPTIFLATHPSLDAAIRIANQPLAAYLRQPVDLEALDRVVSRFLARHAAAPVSTSNSAVSVPPSLS